MEIQPHLKYKKLHFKILSPKFISKDHLSGFPLIANNFYHMEQDKNKLSTTSSKANIRKAEENMEN